MRVNEGTITTYGVCCVAYLGGGRLALVLVAFARIKTHHGSQQHFVVERATTAIIKKRGRVSWEDGGHRKEPTNRKQKQRCCGEATILWPGRFRVLDDPRSTHVPTVRTEFPGGWIFRNLFNMRSTYIQNERIMQYLC